MVFGTLTVSSNAQGGINTVDIVPYLAALSAIAALGLAFYYYKSVEAASPGNERMVFLMTEIQKGAKAFLKKEYTWVSVFVVAMMVLLAIVITPLASVSYVLGASCRPPPATSA